MLTAIAHSAARAIRRTTQHSILYSFPADGEAASPEKAALAATGREQVFVRPLSVVTGSNHTSNDCSDFHGLAAITPRISLCPPRMLHGPIDPSCAGVDEPWR